MPAEIGRPGKLVDTMVAAYLANPGERQLSLDDLALRHFGHKMIPIESLIGKGGRGAANKQKNFSETPIADACIYGAEDADITFRLWELYEKDLKDKDLLDLYFEMEMALLPVLLEMEGKGIALDVDALKDLSVRLAGEIAQLEKDIHALAGEEFNIGSPTQLQVILFEKLGLKAGKKTKTGYSTDADVLGKLEGEHPIISKLLDHRESTKLLNTYVEALPDHGASPYGTRAHQLLPGDRGHRPPLQHQSQPAEHPHPHGVGTAHPQVLHALVSRSRAPVRGLFPDRIAPAGASERGSHPARGLPPEPGHPHPHRRHPLQGAGGPRSPRTCAAAPRW